MNTVATRAPRWTPINVASVVLGAQTPQEVERNVAALSSQAPSALWTDLKAQHLLDTEAPVPSSVIR